jgi:hypothetical protein
LVSTNERATERNNEYKHERKTETYNDRKKEKWRDRERVRRCDGVFKPRYVSEDVIERNASDEKTR